MLLGFPRVITELILSGKAMGVVAAKKQLAQSANAIFFEYFPQASGIGHPLSYYRWLPISDNASALEIETRYQRQGIRIFHSDRFLSGARRPDKFLRVALASTNSLEELHAGLKILKQNL